MALTPTIYNNQILATHPDYELHITTEKRKQKKLCPPFTGVGREYYAGGKVLGYPLIAVLLAFNKGEQWFYGLIHSNLDYTNNTAHIPSSSLSKSDLPKMSIAYKSLKAKGLVKRIRKELYIVNPDALIHPNFYDAIKLKWNSLP